MSTVKPARAGLVTDVAGLAAHAGEHLGYTGWRSLTQEQVDLFADLTEDHNPIHIDPEFAKASPFGMTIAHGYFTVAMLAPLINELLSVQGASISINYGIDRLRFPSPVPVGARFRCGVGLAEAIEIEGGVEIRVTTVVWVEDLPKPALVAECLFRHYA